MSREQIKYEIYDAIPKREMNKPKYAIEYERAEGKISILWREIGTTYKILKGTFNTCNMCDTIDYTNEMKDSLCDRCVSWETKMKPECTICDEPIKQTFQQRKMHGNFCPNCNAEAGRRAGYNETVEN